jgi:hypothetical protein
VPLMTPSAFQFVLRKRSSESASLRFSFKLLLISEKC